MANVKLTPTLDTRKAGGVVRSVMLPEDFWPNIAQIIVNWGGYELQFNCVLAGLLAFNQQESDNRGWEIWNYKRRKKLMIKQIETINKQYPSLYSLILSILNRSSVIHQQRNALSHGMPTVAWDNNNSICFIIRVIRKDLCDINVLSQKNLEDLSIKVMKLFADISIVNHGDPQNMMNLPSRERRFLQETLHPLQNETSLNKLLSQPPPSLSIVNEIQGLYALP